MNSRYNKSFEENLRSRLNKEELPFDEDAWDLMESKLDQKGGDAWWNRSKGIILGVSIIGLLFIGGITWNMFFTDYDNQAIPNQGAVSEIIATDQSENSAFNETNETQVLEVDRAEATDHSLNESPSSSSLDENSNQSTTKESKVNRIYSNSTTGSAPSKTSKKQIITQETNAGSSNRLQDDSAENNMSELLRFSNENSSVRNKLTGDGIIKRDKKKIGLIDSKKKYIKDFSMLSTKASKIEDVAWMLDEPEMVVIEEHVDIPKHYLNVTYGGGMANFEIDEPSLGNVRPNESLNRENYLSLSYLYRPIKRFGIEAGLQVQVFNFMMSQYLEEGTFDLDKDYYVHSYPHLREIQSEPFINLHLYQKINRRLEVDLYGGFYAMQLLAGSGSYGSSSKGIKYQDSYLITHEVEGKTGIEGGARLKLGVNFNILTSKLNTVGVGFAYTSQLYGGPTGTYSLFQSADNTLGTGNLRTNGNGFKVQINYGFGLGKNKLDIRYMNKREIFGDKNFFVSTHFGGRTNSVITKLNECSNCAEVTTRTHPYYELNIGHYFTQKLAVVFGLGYHSEIQYTGPGEWNSIFGISTFNVPVFLQYDLLSKGKFNFYGQAGTSFDFRKIGNGLYPVVTPGLRGFIQEDKLKVNARLGVGADYKLFKGLHIGIEAKYQHAFDTIAEITNQAALSEPQVSQFSVKHSFLSAGINLKYLFTN